MRSLVLIIVVMLFSPLLFAEGGAHFLSDPTLTPDGANIIFVYEGDLWRVSSNGGTAYRITAMDGPESLPRVSPDGKWIAFTASEDGNRNVYAVPSEGGEIRQLTYHSSFDDVDSWSTDSKHIYFTSGRMNSFSSYRVAVDGGTAERLFSDHYWDNSHFVVVNPVNGEFIFSESGESYRNNSRKRYKGENNPDLKSYNTLSGEFTQLTNYNGKDLWPTIDKKGVLYFASDEKTGEYNLFTLRSGTREKLTSFTSSIGRPQVNSNGNIVVFSLDYKIYRYNCESGSSEIVNIDIFTNRPLKGELSFSTEGNISAFDVSPDNKKIAFVSRGRLFVSDIKGELVRELMTEISERVIEVVWSSDNKTLLITRTNHGWPNLYRIAADESFKEIPVREGEKSARMVSLNAGRDKAVYYFGRDELRITDLKNWSDNLVVNGEYWFRGSAPGFSPDNRYVVYTIFKHFESEIMLYDLKLKRAINLTNTFLSEGDPFWSPDNKYIWFTADRTAASYPRGGSQSKLYRIPLNRYSKPFKSDKVDELLGKEVAESVNSGEIDTVNLLRRWEAPLRVGARQSSPYVISMDTVTYVIFNSNHEGSQGVYKLTISQFGDSRIEQIKGINSGSVISSGKDYYSLSRGKIYKLNIKGNKADNINIKFDFNRSLADEFKQMYYEGWTILAENYYDENMHGIDWKAMRSKYEKFLPDVRSREELRLIMNDMLGELNSSHMGFRSQGDEESIKMDMVTAATGILFEKGSPFTVSRVVAMSPADYRGANIIRGDRLVSVNGEIIVEKENRERYFLFPKMPDELIMTFERGGKRHTVKVHPESSGSINGNLYDEWIAGNQERVDNLSDNKYGYVYLKNMGDGSLDQFIIEMTSEEVGKEGLIVDLRYNTGGNIHDDVLKFLAQKPYLEWKFREGMISPQPNFAPAGKPIVLLINQSSLSDAEMTAAGFKELELGTIVGTESYRWIIFTSASGLVDGSSCRLPAWGCYTLDGIDLEFSGVKPDVYIRNSFTDFLNNRDPQLEKAVEVLRERLKSL
jgi:tricorn protease